MVDFFVALHELKRKWLYLELVWADWIDGWIVRNHTDEGIGSEGDEKVYEGKTPQEAVFNAFEKEIINE